MAKETEDRIWANAQFLLTDDPPNPDDFLTRSGVRSVTRTAVGVWDVVLDSPIGEAEEALALCAGALPKVLTASQAVVEKTGPAAYTIRAFDTEAVPAAQDIPIGFTVKRIGNTL